MDDNWMTDVLHRVDERYARERAGREPRAAPFSSIYWTVFCAVALGVPVALWPGNLDFAGTVGSIWQNLVELLAG